LIGSYHRLFEIEHTFRMSDSDLQARPTHHRKRDSIEALLTIVFAALARPGGAARAHPCGRAASQCPDSAISHRDTGHR
jgi:hypothetical protein